MKFFFFLLLGTSFVGFISCRNDKIFIPTGLSYSQNSYTLNFGDTGYTVAPTVQWNGNVGTFNIVSVTKGTTKTSGVNGATAGIAIIGNTGVVTFSRTLSKATYLIEVTTNNLAGSSTSFVDTLKVK